MKKLFFIAAIASAALVSCTKNEVAEVAEQDVITFAQPVTALNTKAVEIGKDYPTSQKFSVFGYYYPGDYTNFSDGKVYMDDVTTAYNSDIKGWDPKTGSGVNYYWPKQGTLTFAAYSPSSVAAKYDATGIHFENFKVDTDCTKQFDLLFSERAYNQTKANMTTAEDPYKGAQIQFNHALSSILFIVKTDADYQADNFEIQLTKISIKNVHTTATFDQGLADANGAITQPVSAANFGWTGHTSEKKEYVAFQSYQTLSTTPAFTNNIVVTNPRENDKNNTNLILLPQEFTEQQLYIEYNILNHNVGTAVSQDATFNLNFYGASWMRGKRYIYNLTFGFDKIYFDPIVTEWDELLVSPDVAIGR